MAVPSDYYLNSHRRRWARWLSLFGLPASHIATVMVWDEAAVVAFLAMPIDRRSAHGQGRPSVHLGRRVYARRVTGSNAPMIRRLAELGYAPALIDAIMSVAGGTVAAWLERERRKAEPRPRPVKAAAWKRTDARRDSGGSTPLPSPLSTIAATEPPLDLVAVAEPPTSATVNPPDDRPAWGCFQHRFATGEAHGRSKLTRAMVDEARAPARRRLVDRSTGGAVRRRP